jgi:hypothetical protein
MILSENSIHAAPNFLCKSFLPSSRLLHYVRGAIIHQEIIMAKTCVTLADLELDLYCNVNTRVRTLEEGAYDIATEVSGV